MLKEEIKKLRLAQGMTQADLAEKLDISPQAVQRWEAGKAQPSAEKIPALAKVFNVSPEALAEVANASVRDEVRKKKLIVATSTAAATVAAGLAINALGLPAPAMGAIVGILGVAFGRLRYSLNKSFDEGSFNPERDLNDAEKKQIEQVLETLSFADKQNVTPIQAVTYVLEHWDEATKTAPSPQGERVQRRIDTNLIEIPVISREWTACCGGGVTALDLTSEDGRVVSIPRASLRAYDDLRPPFAIYCEGDCLESDGIFEGDVVVVNPAEEPLNGATALVSIAGSLSLKHVFTLRNGDIILKSDQGERRLSREQQDKDEFMICGAMVCSIRRPRVWTL